MNFYCDACVLIEAVEGIDTPAARLEDIFRAASLKAVTLTTSALSLAEVLVAPLEQRDQALVTAYTILLSNDLNQQVRSVDVDREILAQAAFIRVRKKSIKLPDAIHIATAELSGCEKILTRDTRWIGATDIPIVDLGLDTLGTLLDINP